MRFSYALLAFALILSACSSAPQAASSVAPSTSSSKPLGQPAVTASASYTEAKPTSGGPDQNADQSSSAGDMVRTDEQGAVVVDVTPLNITNPGESLEFNVELNTHSIDLSMDLATLANLTTDNGKTVQASQWDAPLGGHHVSGKLIFPATVDGQPLLDGAKKLTITIMNLDAPERIFTWELKR